MDADVFLLTDKKPALLPGPRAELALKHDAAASTRLLDDLRGDAGMEWVPRDAWLTELSLNSTVANLKYDLAVGASEALKPIAPIDAGLRPAVPRATLVSSVEVGAYAMAMLVVSGLVLGALMVLRRA